MAAAVVTKMHHMRPKENVHDPTSVPMPNESDSLISAELGRQVVTEIGITWQRRMVMVTHDQICFGKVNAPNLIDYVPLLEVNRVTEGKKAEWINQDVASLAIDGTRGGGTPKGAPGPKQVGKYKVSGKGGQGSPDSRKADGMWEHDHDHEDDDFPFVIQTIPGGHCSGKSIILAAADPDERRKWVSVIDHARDEAFFREKIRGEKTLLQTYQRITADWYESKQVQYSVALVIFATYIIAMLDSQMQPEEGSHAANTFRILEIVFTIVFGIELAINMFAHWWTPFWESRWNVFDFLVVGCSVLSLIIPALPGISVLRLLRVFKMIRLFQQLQSLRVLINALSTSVLPVLNAFVVLLLVTSIYGMLQQIH